MFTNDLKRVLASVLVVCSIVACDKIDNSFDEVRFKCGESSQPGSNFILLNSEKGDLPLVSDLVAFAFNSSNPEDREELSISSKSCLIVPEDLNKDILVVREKDGGLGAVMVNNVGSHRKLL